METIPPPDPGSREHTQFLTESELADRLKTTADSVRWMRRTGKIPFARIAGNRGIRFWWPDVFDSLLAASRKEQRKQQLADIAAHGGDNAECAASDLAKEFPTHA